MLCIVMVLNARRYVAGDQPGNSKFRRLAKPYYRSLACVLVVYDVTRCVHRACGCERSMLVTGERVRLALAVAQT